MRGGDADLPSPGPARAGALHLEVVSGARRGTRVRCGAGPVLVGRAAQAGLRFDPEGDREVSSRHALLFEADGGWWIRDLESRNGTWIGGRRLEGDHRLTPGERIRFGPDGPEVVIAALRAGGEDAAVDAVPEPTRRPTAGGAAAFPRPTLAGAQPPGGPASAAPIARETPSGRLRRLDRENRRLRLGLATAAVLVIVIGAGAAAFWQRSRVAWERERSALLARSDTLLARNQRAVAALEGELGGLRAALEASRAEVTDLSTAVRAAETHGGDPGELLRLRDRLQAAEVALSRQQLAAALDFTAIERLNRRALAMLFVETATGDVTAATAFGVLPDGTLATSRHAVQDAYGRGPARIGVQFADSRQVWRGRVLAISDAFDLALVKVDDVEGETPVVHGTNARADTLAAGTPVALLGFPLAERRDRPVPLVSAGVVRSWGADTVHIQGYGAEGASGSPVLDASGSLIAILYGGSGDGVDRALVAVPAAALEALLAGR